MKERIDQGRSSVQAITAIVERMRFVVSASREHGSTGTIFSTAVEQWANEIEAALRPPVAHLEDALEEIRELTVNPPDARVAIELIQQVVERVGFTCADSALERLARSGALDPDPHVPLQGSEPPVAQLEVVGDLRAYGEEEAIAALREKDRVSHQFWQGWLAALDRVAKPLQGSEDARQDFYEPECGERIVRVYRNGSWLEDTPGGTRRHCSFPDLVAEDARPGGQPQGWQPIETAPKDGTQFLGYGRYSTYSMEKQESVIVDRIDICLWWKGDTLNRADWTDNGRHYFPLTHWMPLPPAPAGE